MKKVIRAFSVLILCGMLALSLVACSGSVGAFSINDETVCTVNGSDVSYDEYKYFFYSHLTDMQKIEPNTDFSAGEGFQRIKELTEYSLAKRRVVLDLCEKYKIELTGDDDDTVDAFVEQEITNTYGGSEEKYQSALLDRRYTGDLFRADAEFIILEGRLYEFLSTGAHNVIDMTPSAIIADVTGGNFYRYKHIFFEMKPGTLSTDLEAEAQRCMYAIATKGFDAAGQEYLDNAKEYSKKGIYVTVSESHATIGEKLEVVEEAVLSLQANKISDVVKSDLGYHIFQRIAIDEDYIEENFYNIENAYATRRYNEVIAAEIEKAKIEYDSEYQLDFAALTKREEIE